MKTVSIRITGSVQGVGYRAWAERLARDRGLSGWIRNRRDGSVEALVTGPPDKVDELVGHLWHGPTAAAVERVETQVAPEQMQLGFRVLPTA